MPVYVRLRLSELAHEAQRIRRGQVSARETCLLQGPCGECNDEVEPTLVPLESQDVLRVAAPVCHNLADI